MEEESRIDEERQRRSVRIRMDEEERIIREREKIILIHLIISDNHKHTHLNCHQYIYNV